MQDFLPPVFSLCEGRSYREFYPGFSRVTFSAARPDSLRFVSHCVRGGAIEFFPQDSWGTFLISRASLHGWADPVESSEAGASGGSTMQDFLRQVSGL